MARLVVRMVVMRGMRTWESSSFQFLVCVLE